MIPEVQAVIFGVVAFVMALLSVSWLLKDVLAHNFRVFAVDRVVLGLLKGQRSGVE